VVLGEESEHGRGARGAPGDVVLFQLRVVAVVADGVEVAVESLFAGGQAERPQNLDQPGQQVAVGLAAHPPGVGAQVGGLGQGRQAKGERQAFVVGERADVVHPGLASALGQRQAAHRLSGAELAGARVVGLADQVRAGPVPRWRGTGAAARRRTAVTYLGPASRAGRP
jgi:hypothetical protein